MERESFENDQVAKALNESFVPIKLDREERPDIDRIYMQYVQATTGHGGWPMNVFITPDLEPVFGGTYWPGPDTPAVLKGGHPGFLGILAKISNLWETDQQRCLRSAKSVTSQLQEFSKSGSRSISAAAQDGPEPLELELLEDSYEHFTKRYDKQHAGFGSAPKFPTPVNLAFLILLGDCSSKVREVVGVDECTEAASMAMDTLRNMTRGGIHDQVGHGFARYSVTRDWSLPHFEKMLYDQGQLLSVYLDAFLVSKDTEMLDAVHDIATYLTEAPMAAPSGGFHSSEDADSLFRSSDKEKREGAFYVWTKNEIESIVGSKDADLCCEYWNVKASGNVDPENDAHDELRNQNVLARTCTFETLAKKHGLSTEATTSILENGRAKLLAHRNKERPRPALDDKIVAGWNGLAIGALARASGALRSNSRGERSEGYLGAAVRAATFVKRELFDAPSGQLKRVYREGVGDAPGFADDYAFLISGLIDLYEATFDDEYLQLADSLQKTQITLFEDPQNGGFFSTQAGQQDIILRLKDSTDGAEPSTNGISASNLYRLGSLFEDEEYTKKAARTIEAFAEEASQHPFSFTSMMSSIVASHFGVKSIAICGDDVAVEDAVNVSRTSLRPNVTVTRLGGSAKSHWLKGRNKLLASMDSSKPSLQVCHAGSCKVLEAGDAIQAFAQD
ncbi:MAG: hypothetical protein M1828_005658 [Chrysothrix sp. TS-e1954]|nr:MAG: hypothetical protein M1828_005658 [Chrysothrix sp. TS-e1954]